MDTINQYDRWQGFLASEATADTVEFTHAAGASARRPVFLHQPAAVTYDVHGYETIAPAGVPVPAARFTPELPGTWRYAWMDGERVVATGQFSCAASAHPGYVEISRHNPRYFAFTNGASYTAIGLNLCMPEYFALSTGQEFQTSARRGTLGAREYARWFRTLAENGGNYARLWLGGQYFQVEGKVAGELDLPRFAAIDRIVDLARQYGIRLKLCLEYFRNFDPGNGMSRVLRHPADGRAPADMDEWFQSPDWQGLWQRKVDALLARYGDDPVVMAWELWNEIDCCATRDFAVQEAWTRRMLTAIKAAAPRHLVTNSLGSFDGEEKQARQDAFLMPEMDFQQVHRYLDQGAGIASCRTDPVQFTIEAIQRSRRADRPVLLAETGAVNDCHSGPFRYYHADHDGLLFHDTTYPAFFAGAAGSGHIWHWDNYVDAKNLWAGFRALAAAVQGVAIDREDFTLRDLSTPEVWRLLLCGRRTTLAWVRNRADRWDSVLRDDLPTSPLTGVSLDLAGLGITPTEVALFRPWPDDGMGELTTEGARVCLPPFRHGLILRIQHDA